VRRVPRSLSIRPVPTKPCRQAARPQAAAAMWLPRLITAAVALLRAGHGFVRPAGSSAHDGGTTARRRGATEPRPAAGAYPGVPPGERLHHQPEPGPGGHLWCGARRTAACVRDGHHVGDTTRPPAKTWRVIVYSAGTGRPDVAGRSFTLKRGWYWWGFGVHPAHQGHRGVRDRDRVVRDVVRALQRARRARSPRAGLAGQASVPYGPSMAG